VAEPIATPDPGGAPPPPPLPAPPARPRRLVYLGTPQMAVPPLRALHEAGFDVALVVTGPDRKRGRSGATSPTPVKAAALELGLPVSHDVAEVTEAGADLGVVVAFGQLLRRPVLEVLPMVNLHFSLLPRWRGAAPVERAILAGDDRTGVCVMAVEEGLDTGAVYRRAEVAIGPRTTAAELAAELTDRGARLLVDALRDGLADPEPQRGEATYAAKLFAGDRRLDWHLPARDLDRRVRVGGAWTTYRGRRFKVLDAEPAPAPEAGDDPPGTLRGDLVACGAGRLRLLAVQAEGKAATAFAAWANGARPTDPDRFDEDT